MYLVPPMDDEPPPEYVAFVAGHLGALRRETDRLVGGDFEAGHLYMDVLADVAGHWRRLCWWAWLARKDAATEYMRRRLASRTKQWRDEQIYEVDIRVLPPQPYYSPARGRNATLALRKAEVLPDTVRRGMLSTADAGIAWVHAYRRQEWRRVGRWAVTSILLVGGLIQCMSWLSVSP
jgi:hypothetical protein